MASSDWKTFRVEELIAQQEKSGSPYLEFLRVPSMSCGLYSLPAGSTDLQNPHDEDEVYFVVRGRAVLQVDGEQRQVGPGSILYVRATSEHSFIEIEEDVLLMVFFATGGPSGE